MKNIFIILACFVASSAIAQCDNAFFPFEEGVVFEQTAYDKKGKEQGKTKSEILNVEGATVSVGNAFYDKKGEQIAEADYSITCEDNVMKMDFGNFIPKQMLDQYGDADIKVEGDFITIPNDLEAGQELEDAAGKIIISVSGMNIKMDMNIVDRKVEKAETLETPAGSYPTYKINQKTIVKTNIMGMNKTVESTSSSWFAKGVGMVKTESYHKNGNLLSSTLLTAFSKN